MIVSCPSCGSKYRVDPDVLQKRAGRVKCSSCSHVWTVEDEPVPLEEPVIEEDLQAEPSFEEELEPELPTEPEAEPQPEPAPSLKTKPHTAIRRREAERKQKTRTVVERAGWAGIAACFIAIVCTGYFMRISIVDAWPRAAGAYAAVGLKVDPVGLTVEELNASMTDDQGTPVLVVEGIVRNISSRKKDVPSLLAQILDSRGDILAEWSLNLEHSQLDKGASEQFSTRFAAPPDGGARVEVVLADSPNESTDKDMRSDHTSSQPKKDTHH